MFSSITAIILTLNEAPNIERVLAKLGHIQEVYVVDSGSTDDTAMTCARFSNVKFIVNPFVSHEAQWRFAVARVQADALATGRQPKEWVLTLDADYVLSDCLIEEINALTPPESISGYACAFQFWIDAGPVPASLYPPRTVLFRPTQAHYYMRGHTQLLKLNGTLSVLKGLIYHDDRKSWARFLSNQRKYAVLEAAHLRRAAWSELRIQDKVRLTGLIAPWLVPLLTYMRIWPAGRRAIKYCAMRFTSEFGIAKTLWRMRFAEFFRIEARQKVARQKKDRIDDTRRKILVGAIVLSKIETGELLLTDKKSLLNLLSNSLTREPDRALFFFTDMDLANPTNSNNNQPTTSTNQPLMP